MAVSPRLAEVIEMKNSRKKKPVIPKAHSIPSWRKPLAAASLWAQAILLLSYAICRRVRACLDGNQARIDCGVRYQFSSLHPPSHWDCR